MKKCRSAWMVPCLVVSLVLPVSLPVRAGTNCFAAAKIYQVHPLRGGPDAKDGWSVRGDAFSQCVRRSEAADKTLRARYPETIYALSLASTIGCHAC